MMPVLQSAIGLAILLAICAFFSNNRNAIRPTLLVKGLLLQMIFALLLLKMPTTQILFEFLNRGLEVLQQSTAAGTNFVFGYLGGGELPYDETHPGASYILAFQTMPMLIVISVLSRTAEDWHARSARPDPQPAHRSATRQSGRRRVRAIHQVLNP